MSIKLTRKSLTLGVGEECRRNWSIEVTAESTTPDLDSRILVFHTASKEDSNGDTFSNVASLQDMNTIPADASELLPGESAQDNYIPFYRSNSVVLDFHTAEEAERVWRIIRIDTMSLMREFRAARNLTDEEIYICE